MNTENGKTNEPHRFKLNLQINLISKVQTKHDFSQFKYLLDLEKHQVRIKQQ